MSLNPFCRQGAVSGLGEIFKVMHRSGGKANKARILLLTFWPSLAGPSD